MSTTLRTLIEEARRLGWRWVIGYRILKRLGIREVKFHPPGLRTPVYCRVEGSDIYEFEQSLGSWAVPLRLNFEPRTIVDVGANVGYASLRFAREFPNARIIAVEPAPANLVQLKKNCLSYPNILLENCAIWPRSRRLRIARLEVDHNAYSIVEDPEGDIQAMRIPDLLSRYGLERVELLKIDIEGGEYALFDDENAREWLKCVGMLLIETHDRMVPGCSDAVRRAVKGIGAFQGHVNEYEYWLIHSPVAS
jgi:FkbM family methyltransferase